MRWIIDANALIYMVKAGLHERFRILVNHEMVIDTSVYEESVLAGMRHGYADATLIKKFLESNRIPIIPVDVEQALHVFKDAGETSCFLLSGADGVCITADTRAIKKIRQQGGNAIHLDVFFYRKAINGELPPKDLEGILNQLETVHGTTPERKHELLKSMEATLNHE